VGATSYQKYSILKMSKTSDGFELGDGARHRAAPPANKPGL
jgi:hypothetical protein